MLLWFIVSKALTCVRKRLGVFDVLLLDYGINTGFGLMEGDVTTKSRTPDLGLLQRWYQSIEF